MAVFQGEGWEYDSAGCHAPSIKSRALTDTKAVQFHPPPPFKVQGTSSDPDGSHVKGKDANERRSYMRNIVRWSYHTIV